MSSPPGPGSSGGACLALLGLSASLLPACDANFSAQRANLDGPRIAALGVQDGVAQAAVWSGQGLYHDEAPALRWFLDGLLLGSGHEVAVPAEGERLTLELTMPDDTQLLAEVGVASILPELALSRAEWSGWETGADLALEARAPLGEPVDGGVASGSVTRLSLAPVEPAAREISRIRWMTAFGQGKVLGAAVDAADFFPEEFVLEDGELSEVEPLGDGVYGLLALDLGESGDNRWLWIDAPVGQDEAGWLRHEGRLLPWTGGAPVAGLFAGTVRLTEDLAGVALDDLEQVEDTDSQDLLACAPAGEPFRLAWLAEGRCTRPELDGARVVVETW